MMAKKRKANVAHKTEPDGPNLDVGQSKVTLETSEDVADSADEFHLNRDEILLGEGPQAKRRRKLQEEAEFLEPSDEEVLGYSDEGSDDIGSASPAQQASLGDTTSDHSGEDEVLQDWGLARQDIYGADAVETEEQALAEEAEALRLQKQHLQSLTAADYGFDEAAWRKDAELDGARQGDEVVTEILPRLQIEDHLSDAEKLHLLHSHYPEFQPLSTELLQLHEAHRESLRLIQSSNDMDIPNGLANFRAASAYMSALGMYFVLLTSPASQENADAVAMPAPLLRDHPIMETLVKCRDLWLKAKELPQDGRNSAPEEAAVVRDQFESASRGDVLEPQESELTSQKSRTQRHNEAMAASGAARRVARITQMESELADLDALAAPPTDESTKAAAARKKPSTVDSDAGEDMPLNMDEATEKARRKKSLRFYTSQIAQKANKRGTAGRNAGGDDDIPHRERLKDRQARLNTEAEKRGHRDSRADAALGGASDEEDALQAQEVRASADNEDYYSVVAARTAKKKRQEKELAEARRQVAAQHGQVVEEATIGPDGKRKVSYAIEMNKGLAPRRKKELRNPRVKKRKKFDEKKKKLASMKPTYKGGEGRGGYGGELTGIKKNLVKSTKL